MKASELGETLRNRRKRARLTQRQLAEAIGVSSNTVALWEQGDGLSTVSRFFDALAETGVEIRFREIPRDDLQR